MMMMMMMFRWEFLVQFSEMLVAEDMVASSEAAKGNTARFHNDVPLVPQCGPQGRSRNDYHIHLLGFLLHGLELSGLKALIITFRTLMVQDAYPPSSPQFCSNDHRCTGVYQENHNYRHQHIYGVVKSVQNDQEAFG
mmetsp:Transcript_39515/g.63887  ORF Transcript_39515/g.63887 Transcript_39515/m.63887 type:complete len:137 (+) Transcript_39515:56-466(+)